MTKRELHDFRMLAMKRNNSTPNFKGINLNVHFQKNLGSRELGKLQICHNEYTGGTATTNCLFLNIFFNLLIFFSNTMCATCMQTK